MSLDQALALHRAGKRRDARPLYEMALKQRPDDPQTRFAYGLCLLVLVFWFKQGFAPVINRVWNAIGGAK